MKGSLKRSRFELEALEPRCLLSGSVALLAPGAASAAALGTGAEIQHQVDSGNSSQDSSAYNPVAQVGSILPSASSAPATTPVAATTPSTSESGANQATGSQNGQTQAQNTQINSTGTSTGTGTGNTASQTSTGSSQVVGSPTTQQLTETLTAANAPPQAVTQTTPGAQAPVLPGLQFAGSGVESLAGQVFYLDFSGASGVNYHGPVEVDGINIPAFSLAADGLAGQEEVVISRTVDALNAVFSPVGVTFTTSKPPANSEFSTIFIGGSGSEFAQYGTFWGLAEEVDAGNLNRKDNAFVFSDRLSFGALDASVQTLIGVIQHEAGHLLGYKHTNTGAEGGSPLSSVADAGVSLSGVPQWTQQGPGPIQGSSAVALSLGNNVAAGAIQAIAVDPANPNIVYVGTVNGGVWMTTDITATATVDANQLVNPAWTKAPDVSSVNAQLKNVAGVGLMAGTYQYKFVYKLPDSNASAAFTFTSDGSENGIELTGIPYSSSGITTVYRTKAGGSTFYWVHQLASPTDKYDDNVPDSSLGTGSYTERTIAVPSPVWTPLTDNQPSLAIGALAIGPYDSEGNLLPPSATTNTDTSKLVIYAGTGSFSSAGLSGGAATGILKSNDGGITWTLLGQSTFSGLRVTSVLPTSLPGGQVVLAATYDQVDALGMAQIDGTTASTFAVGDIADLDGFASRLKQQAQNDPVSQYLYGQLQSATQTLLSNYVSGPNSQLQQALVGDLNTLIQKGSSIFSTSRFAGVVLSPQTQALKDQNPQGAGLVLLNRLLIEDAYPLEIAKSQGLVTKMGGVFISTTGGASWARVSGGGSTGVDGLPDGPVTDLKSGSSANRFYAALPGNGIYFSDDGGQTWAQMNTGLSGIADSIRIKLSVIVIKNGTGSATDLLYAGFISTTGQQEFGLTGLFRTDGTGGTTWQSINLPSPSVTPEGQGMTNFSILADSNNTVYLGGDTTASNTDTAFGNLVVGVGSLGSSGWTYKWDPIVGTGANKTSPHADSRGLAFDLSSSPANLLEVDDGGIYRLTNYNDAGTRKWESLNGNLGITEFISVAYDSQNNRVIGGTQDNGNVMQTANGSTTWKELLGGDGAVAQIGVSGGIADYYFSTPNLGDFLSQIANQPMQQIGLLLSGRLSNLYSFDKSLGKPESYFAPFVLDAVDPTRMLIGTQFLYESTNDGKTLVSLGGVGGFIFGHPVNPFGDVTGVVHALAYGGMHDNLANPDVFYAGVDDHLFLRTSAKTKDDPNSGSITELANYPGRGSGHNIRDIVLDPDDWQKAFVIDDRNVYMVTGAGTANEKWQTISLLLPMNQLMTVQVVKSAGHEVVLVGGLGGVFRAIDPDPVSNPNPHWTEFGDNLPNVLVTDLRYYHDPTDPTKNLILAGTLGRGAWTIPDADVATEAVMTVNGDSTSGQNDQIRLALNYKNPLFLDVFINDPTNPARSIPLSVLDRIEVNGLLGDDTLTVDASNGLIAVPGGIHFDGGPGNDTLSLLRGLRSYTTALSSDLSNSGSRLTVGDGRNMSVQYDNTESVVSSIPTTLGDPLGALNNGLLALAGVSGGLTSPQLLNKPLPLFGSSLGNVLNGDRLFHAVGGAGGGPQVAQFFGDAAGSDILSRLFEAGAGGFDIKTIGTASLDTLTALRDALDGLDNTPNVTLTVDNNTGLIKYDVGVVTTLSGTAPLEMSALDGRVALDGNVAISATVALHVVFGVDAGGFFVQAGGGTDPFLVVSNIQVTGAVQGTGNFGFLQVTVSNATVAVDPNVKLLVYLQAPGTNGAGGLIRLGDLSAIDGSLATAQLMGNPNAAPDDLVVTGDFNVAAILPGGAEPFTLGSTQVAFKWKDINNPAAMQIMAATNGGQSLLDFLNIDPNQALTSLKRLGDWLGEFRDLPVFSSQIPFTSGTTVGQAFDFSKAFVDNVYSQFVEVGMVAANPSATVTQTGALTADAKFSLQIDDNAPVSVIVYMTPPASPVNSSNTSDNTTLLDLVDDFNSAFQGTPGLAGKVEAALEGTHLAIVLTPGAGTSIKLTADSATDPILTEVGFADSQTSAQAPVFDTFQEFAGKLSTILSTDLTGNVPFDLKPGFDPATNSVTLTISLTSNFSTTVPLSFGQSFGTLGNVQLNGNLQLDASVTLNFILGLDLSGLDPPRIVSSTMVPVPANGRLSNDATSTKTATFTVILNGDTANPMTLTLHASDTTSNTSIDQLAGELNTLFGTVSYNGTPLGTLIEAQKAGPNLAIAVKSTQSGINQLELDSASNDPFATELGFGTQISSDGQTFSSVSNATAKGLFLKNVGLTGSVQVSTPGGIKGSLRLGFVDVTTDGGTIGTYAADGTTPKAVSVAVSVTNQTTGAQQFYLSDLLDPTSPNNIANLGLTPTIQGGFLARLNDIQVGGLGFNVPLDNPQVSLWIPDITNLTYNSNTYDPNNSNSNKGLFVTYPSLGALQNLSSLGFAQIIQALQIIASNLGQLSAFSFLNDKLPLIDMSVNDLIGYAAKFSGLVTGLSNGGAQSLQQVITSLNTQIDRVLGLNPNVLTIGVDDGGISGLTVTTTGGINGSSNSYSATLLNPEGLDNDIYVRNNDLNHAGDLNGTVIRVLDDSTIADATATASWDATNKVLTIRIHNGVTTANAVITAINTAPISATWTASVGGTGEDGKGTITTSSFVTRDGVNASQGSTTTIMPGGDNNDFTITSTAASGGDLNGSIISIVGDSSLSGSDASVKWDATNKILTIGINPGQTTAKKIVDVIAQANTNASLPWTAGLRLTDNGKPEPDGSGVVTTIALKFALKYSTASANSATFALDLNKLIDALDPKDPTVAALLQVASSLVQVQGSGNLAYSVGADLELDFGLDLTNPTSIRPFLYDTTGVTLTAKVTGTNLTFQATMGSVAGIFIENGTVTLDADGDPSTGPLQGDKGAVFSLGLRNSDGSGRRYFDQDWLSSQNFDLHLTGGVRATLPIFAPLQGTPLGTGTNAQGYPSNDLVVDIPDLVRFFGDTQADGGTAILRIPGPNNDLKIIGVTGAPDNFTVVLADGGLAAPSWNSSTNTLTIYINSGTTSAAAFLQQYPTFSSNGASFSATHIGDSTNNQNGTLTISRIAISVPDFSQLFANLDFCTLITSAASPLLDGLDKLLGSIQDGLDQVVLNARLPLIGNGLAGAANFIKDFRNGLLAELRTDVSSAGNATTAIENAIKQALWNSLGPGGLKLLVDPTTGNPLDMSLGYSQLNVTFDCNTGLTANLRLKKDIKLLDTSGNPINFDIGVPGFDLKANGNVAVSVGFDLRFGFGVDPKNGFYFIANTATDLTSLTNAKLHLYFSVSIPSLHFSGQLAFLQLDIADDGAAPSQFSGQYDVFLMDPSNNGKLTWAEMTSSGTQLSDILHAQLTATASVNLDLVASFGGNAAFPSVDAQFHLRWGFDSTNGAGTPQIWFDNVGLDVGSFISGFLGSLLNEVQKVTEPIEPIIKLVTARIPILSDILGKDTTMLTLAQDFGLLEPSTVEFIQEVAQVITLINDIHDLGTGDLVIPFGGFSLSYDSAGQMSQIGGATGGHDNENFLTKIQKAGIASGTSQTFKEKTAKFAGDLDSLNNFSIPIFDHPTLLFNLFIGKPVALVEWRMPEFKFKFTYVQQIPIYPPLDVLFGGSIEADINIGFGYDTLGIQEYSSDSTKNLADLLDGFYILTTDANGKSQPALQLTGAIFAGADLNFGIADAGVNGGIKATIGFYWNDNSDNDGKMRFSEIAANAAEGASCIFDMKGSVSVFFQAFLDVKLGIINLHKVWDLGEITLVDFSYTCPQPVLGDWDSSTHILTLNIGTRAGDRLVGDTSDDSETFIVRHVDGAAGDETVDVTFSNHVETFTHVKSILVPDAGQGNDVLDFRGVLSSVNVNGGAGNDTIYLSDGPNSVAHGGSGNDTIVASSATTATGVTIYADSGNDTITAGTQAITIYAGSGNSTIYGSTAGNDFIYGGTGNNIIHGGAGNDYIDGVAGNTTIYVGDGNNFILTGSGNDKVYGGAGDNIVVCGTGNCEVRGGAGNDLLIGGNGNVQMYGEGGNDILIGANVTSIDGFAITEATPALTLSNAANNLKPVLDNLVVPAGANQNPANLVIQGLSGGGNDLLVGGGGSDVIFGGKGNCTIYGGNLVTSGTTAVIEPDGNNFIAGGPGNDVIFADDATAPAGTSNTGISIKSSIWFDANSDGVHDPNEKGFAGVTVSLYIAGNSTPIATQTTDTDGAFQFVGLDPNNYFLGFSTPNNLVFTKQSVLPVSQADNDSDVNPNTQLTGIFNLSYNQTFTAVSAGYTGPVTVSITDASVKQGSSGQTALVFPVTLSTPQGSPVQVSYRTVDGTANVTDGDFVPASGTLTFNPGETSKQITVLINGDTTYEPTEQFQLLITGVTPGTLVLSQPSATGTIINPNPVPTIDIHSFDPGDRSLLAAGDFFNQNDLISQLTQPLDPHFSDPLTSYLRSQMSQVSHTAEWQVLASTMATPLQKQSALVAELNAILEGPSLYNNPALFAGITLSYETVHALAQNPQGQDLIRLNRLLLEDAYPQDLPGMANDIAAFSGGDLLDPMGLVLILSNASSEPVSFDLWTRLSSQQGVLTNPNSTGQAKAAALLDGLNAVLAGASIYDSTRFANITLSAATQALRLQNPQGGDLIRLNRLLLQDAYPQYFAANLTSTSLYSASDLVNPAALISVVSNSAAINNSALGRVSFYLWQQFSTAQQGILRSNAASSQDKLSALVAGLSTVVQGVVIYDPTRFAGVTLSADTTNLLNKTNRSAQDLMLLNRRLLQDACPQYFGGSTTSTSVFAGGDLVDPPALIQLFQLYGNSSANLVSFYLWNRFSPSQQGVLTSGTATLQDQESALVAGLNTMLQGVSIYDPARFAGITLSADTQYLLTHNSQGADLVRLNRLLLQDAYPQYFATSTGGSSLFSTSDLIDPAGLTLLLSNSPSALVSSYLWQRILPADRATLTSAATSSQARLSLLVNVLSPILGGASIYDAGRFGGVSLSGDTQYLLTQNPQGQDSLLLNRLLLQDAYPKLVARLGVAVSTPGESSVFVNGDFFNPAALIQQLSPPNVGALSVYLWSQIAPADQLLLTSLTATTQQKQTVLVADLNQILQRYSFSADDVNHIPQGTSLFDLASFTGVTLSAETSYWLTQKPQGKDLIHLNRLLLDDAYGADIAGIAGTEGMPATFVVTLSNPSDHAITVDWRTDLALTPQGLPENGAAVPFGLPDPNFVLGGGTLTFQPGVTSLAVTVQTLANNLDQVNTHFYVDLSNSAYAAIGQGHGFGLIRNSDPPVNVFIAPVQVTPDLGPFTEQVTTDPALPKFICLQVSLSGPSGKEIVVTYGTTPGTAVESVAPGSTDVSDYVGIPNQDTLGKLVFEPGGPRSQTITLEINPHLQVQDDKTFFVNLLSATNATIAAKAAQGNENNHFTVIIHDPNTVAGTDYGPWSVAFSSSQYDVQEPSKGSQTVVDITLVRTPGSSEAMVVFYTSDGTATAGLDYQKVFRTLVVFGDGELTHTVHITILNDGQADGDETVILSLRNPTGDRVRDLPDTAALTIHEGNATQAWIEAPLLGATILSDRDLTDFNGLVSKLSTHTDSVSSYLWSRFPAIAPGLRAELLTPDAALEGNLVAALNTILQSSSIYDANRFAAVKLSPITAELVSRNPTAIENNRWLLADAYPGQIAQPVPTLSALDFTDFGGLVSKLTSPADPVSTYLAGLPDVHAALTGAPASLQANLIAALNTVLQGFSIYDPSRFAAVKLSPITADLVARNPTSFADRLELNRALLADAYPGQIAQPSYGMVEGTSAVPSTFAPHEFIVRLTAPAGPGGVRIWYETVSLTARSEPGPDQDFMPNSGFVDITAGEDYAAISVQVQQDSTPEPTETFFVRLTQISSLVPASLGTGPALDPLASGAVGTIYDDDLTPVTGKIFYDANGNGFRDTIANGSSSANAISNEPGISGVAVDVTYSYEGTQHTITVTTDAHGVYTANVYLGPVSIAVHGDTVKSPFGLTGAGATYTTTTNNETQSINFQGIQGLPAFADVGYHINSTTSVATAGSKDMGTGATNSTVFGGPGNDAITVGAGNDYVVGGSWMTATDSNAPINKGSYDAVLTITTINLPPLDGTGPIWAVDTNGLAPYGSITGAVLDSSGQPYKAQAVVVDLYDCEGNLVNSTATSLADGTYAFNGLYLSKDGSTSDYVVQFDLPAGYTFVTSAPANKVTVGARTEILHVSQPLPTQSGIDAVIQPSNTVPVAGGAGFQFADSSYSVSEAVSGGLLSVTVIRGNSLDDQPVALRTEAGTASLGVNYGWVSALLDFGVGETVKTVNIPIFNTTLIKPCTDPLTFSLVLRDPTGLLLARATVYIGGQSYGSLTDDDTIQLGGGWDVVLGDSGNIVAGTVISNQASLASIADAGGPGNDTIHAGSGPDYIKGQLGKDVIYTNLGFGTLIDGGGGTDTLISTQDVPIINLTSSTSDPTGGTLTYQTAGGITIGTTTFTGIEQAELFGGPQDNTFELTGWNGSASVIGGGGKDTLHVKQDSDMMLKDATTQEGLLFQTLYGFTKDASLSLANGATYQLSGITNVILEGGAGDNILDASGYSRAVTFVGTSGNDTLIGGSGNDTFMFNADTLQGLDIITGNGGSDTVDFSSSTNGVIVDLSQVGIVQTPEPTSNANFKFELMDEIENVTGGAGSDTLTGNALNNVIIGGTGNDTLTGGGGNDTYPLDTDRQLGSKTIIDYSANPNFGTLDFSGTLNYGIHVDLSILGTAQKVNDNLMLTLIGNGIGQVIGGAGDDVIHGNNRNDVLRGGLGNDTLVGGSADNVLDGGPGTNTLTGGGGVNTVSAEGDTNFALTNISLTLANGEQDALYNIQNAILTGGQGANVFNLTGWTGTGTIDGGGGASGTFPDDTVKVAADADFTLTDTNTLPGLASLDLSNNSVSIAHFDLKSISIVILSDTHLGTGTHTLDASQFSGDVTLNAGAGGDILIGGQGSNILNGGAGNDTINGGLGSNIVTGGGGTDTYVKKTGASQFFLGNNALVTYVMTTSHGLQEYTDTITNIQNVTLTGTASTILFNASGWTAGNLTLNGGTGTNTFQVTGWTGGTVTLNGGTGSNTATVQVGASGTITLNNNVISIAGGTGTLSLNSIQNFTLVGSSGNDVFDVTHWTPGTVVTATIRSGGGSDTIEAQSVPNGTITLTDMLVTLNNGGPVITIGLDSIQNATLTGSSNDTLDASQFSGPVILNAGSGPGTETLKGGGGDDTFAFQPTTSSQIVNVDGGLGANTLQFKGFQSPPNFTLSGGSPQNITSNVKLYFQNIQKVTLVPGPQIVTGSAPNSTQTVSNSPTTTSGNTGNNTAGTSASTNSAPTETPFNLSLLAAWLESFRAVQMAGEEHGDAADTFGFSSPNVPGSVASGGLWYGRASDVLYQPRDGNDSSGGWSELRLMRWADDDGLLSGATGQDGSALGLSHAYANRTPLGADIGRERAGPGLEDRLSGLGPGGGAVALPGGAAQIDYHVEANLTDADPHQPRSSRVSVIAGVGRTQFNRL